MCEWGEYPLVTYGDIVNNSKLMDRRKFLKEAAVASTVLALPSLALGNKVSEKTTFGMIADVHQDLIPDGKSRLEAFINESKEKPLDFIIQMGDFCIPKEENLEFLNIFNNYPGDKYHVLGNHDTDGGFNREQTIAFWGMEDKYYSYDKGGLHFVVLDGNDPNPQPFEGYNRFIGPEQIKWLQNDLRTTELPTVIFSHQTLENEDGGSG